MNEKEIFESLLKIEKNIVVKDDFFDVEFPEWGEDYSDEALFGDGISSKSAKLKDPKGGLTAAGRKHFKRTQGANLKPGVKGAADTPEKMRRKGSFLTRFFTNPSGTMVDEKGRATRLALSAAAWGERVPKNAEDAAALAAKGRRLLERYENTKKKKKDAFEGIDSKVFSEMSDEEKIEKYIDSLTDEEFEKMFPIGGEMNLPKEEKWLFDVAGAFLRRSVTNRRKKRKRKDASIGIETKSKKKPAFWEQPSPSKGKTSKLTDSQKKKAKARAKAAGRPYPNLVDNAWAAKQKP
jgi:hypothetical protein